MLCSKKYEISFSKNRNEMVTPAVFSGWVNFDVSLKYLGKRSVNTRLGVLYFSALLHCLVIKHFRLKDSCTTD